MERQAGIRLTSVVLANLYFERQIRSRCNILSNMFTAGKRRYSASDDSSLSMEWGDGGWWKRQTDETHKGTDCIITCYVADSIDCWFSMCSHRYEISACTIHLSYRIYILFVYLYRISLLFISHMFVVLTWLDRSHNSLAIIIIIIRISECAVHNFSIFLLFCSHSRHTVVSVHIHIMYTSVYAFEFFYVTFPQYTLIHITSVWVPISSNSLCIHIVLTHYRVCTQ